MEVAETIATTDSAAIENIIVTDRSVIEFLLDHRNDCRGCPNAIGPNDEHAGCDGCHLNDRAEWELESRKQMRK